MKKFFRTLFWLTGISILGFVLLKFYNRVKEVLKISKTLPGYIKNIYNEKPEININLMFNSLKIVVKISQKIIEENDDLEDTIREYIIDFYPHIASCKLDLKIEEIDVENEGTDNEDENIENEPTATDVSETVSEESTEEIDK